MRSTYFLLSPASLSGRRARQLLSPHADFEIARRLRGNADLTLGEVFSFVSALYFRGKLAYARRFGHASGKSESAFVITPSRGLLPSHHPVTTGLLEEFAAVAIDLDEPRYRVPLEESSRALATAMDPGDRAVLLGSIATGKYGDVLSAALGERLLFPATFVGRGDMSRGGLMLRAASAGDELEYVPLRGAVHHGPRVAKLGPAPTRNRAGAPRALSPGIPPPQPSD